MQPTVIAVSRNAKHTISKDNETCINLIAGLGVEGDVHAGAITTHRSRQSQRPLRPNLRQVHLIHTELLQELAARGFRLAEGEMGENVTTRGIDLLSLPIATRLHLGDSAIVELTGLRNPCIQLEHVAKGLMEACLDRDDLGRLVRKAGVMSIVVASGEVRPGDAITIEMPAHPYRALAPV